MMQHLTAAWRRATALILRRRLERDLDDELAFHLAMREADYRSAGLSDDAVLTEAARNEERPTTPLEKKHDAASAT